MISVVTVAMNRTGHLIRSAQALASLNFNSEYIIVDYGSNPKVRREDLPGDSRIKLYHCPNTNNKWWLTHPYNLAFAISSQPCVLKVDADIILGEEFFYQLKPSLSLSIDLMCSRLTLQDWDLKSSFFTTNGLFLAKKKALEELHGFNPYIRGWGWDEIDLYSRFLCREERCSDCRNVE